MINNLKYADDTTLVSGSLDDLKIHLNTVKETSEKGKLDIKYKKTKFMKTVGLQEFELKDNRIKIVYNFNFLRSIICDNADCQKEIRRRLAMGRSTMIKQAKIIKEDDISVATKPKMVYSLVFSVVTYGSES